MCSRKGYLVVSLIIYTEKKMKNSIHYFANTRESQQLNLRLNLKRIYNAKHLFGLWYIYLQFNIYCAQSNIERLYNLKY